METMEHREIVKDIKKLKKKFPAPRESLDSWTMLFGVKGLSETPSIDKYSGFGCHNIYKARVIPKSENIGKSSGYRLIFEIRGNLCILLCFLRHGFYKKEQDLIRIIKHRIMTSK